MSSFRQNRRELAAEQREAEREPIHHVSLGYPTAYVDLANAIIEGNPAHGQPSVYGVASVRNGWAGDDYEAARRLLARGIRQGELTDKWGNSSAPVLNGAK